MVNENILPDYQDLFLNKHETFYVIQVPAYLIKKVYVLGNTKDGRGTNNLTRHRRNGIPDSIAKPAPESGNHRQNPLPIIIAPGQTGTNTTIQGFRFYLYFYRRSEESSVRMQFSGNSSSKTPPIDFFLIKTI